MDSFAGLGFSGGKRPEKMSLAEQLKQAESAKASTRAQQASEWDSVFGSSSASASPAPSQHTGSVAPTALAASPAPQQSQSASLIDEFDIFVSAKPATKPVQPSQPPVDDDPLALFTAPPAPSPAPSHEPESQPSQPPQQTQRSTSREPVMKPQRQQSRQAGRQSTPGSDDAKIAQLVDMGFDAETAQKALHAMNGDVRGAVSYIMADAQGAPLPTPKRHPQDHDIGALASEFHATMLAKASSMWSFGKKQIAKAVSEYQANSASDGTPAWMRDAEKYRSRETSSPQPSHSTELPPRPPRPNHSSLRQPSPRQPSPRQPSQSSARQFTSDDAMPSRPSRAQAFREKRAAMQDAPSSPGSNPASGSVSGSVSSSASASGPNSRSASRPAPDSTDTVPTPTVDLLNLDSQSTPTSTLDIWSTPAPSAQASTSILTSGAGNHRGNGLEAYKRGDYALAVEHFDAALAALEATHILRALILSNRAACNLKSGNFRGAIDDTQQGLQVLPAGRLDGIEIEPGKPAKDIWSKLVLRQAEALEHAERYAEALQAYQQLMDNGFASPTVLASRRRCQKALDPQIEAKASAPVEKKSQRRKWNTPGEPTSAAGKAALQKVRDEHKRQATLEAERDGLRDAVAQRIDTWKTGKEENLRALLSSLHTVLWPESGWQPVGLHDLVLVKKVRIVYMKAVAKTHPDKVPASASTEVKMIAQGVFVAINKAWDTFRTENNL